MNAHHTGTLALWSLRVVKDWLQPVSEGCRTLTPHWRERASSKRTRLKSTSMNGIPANSTTTTATHTRVSMRAAESRPLLPSSAPSPRALSHRSEEHTSELQSLIRISYADFCLKTNTKYIKQKDT